MFFKQVLRKTQRTINRGIRLAGYEVNQVLYRPWEEPGFQKYYQLARPRSLVTVDRCYILHQFARQCLGLPGDFAECGVYKGGTAYLIADTMNSFGAKGKTLHLFDTFAGMPASANEDNGPHVQGDFGDTSLESVKQYVSKFNNVEFRPGYIPDTFQPLTDRSFAFAHIDVDLFQTAVDCMQFFYPRLSSGGVMIFDDYGFHQYKHAARKAVDEFFQDKPEVPIVLKTGQCLVIKL